MLVNQLICLPTPDTIDYFKTVFEGCSFEIDWSTTYVEINSSESNMEANEDGSYVAYAGTMDRFYDSATGESALILPLRSPDLEARAQAVRAHAPSVFYGDSYFPHMVIKQIMPPQRAHRRGLLHSYAEVLSANQEPLIFDAEFVITRELFTIPHLDYYTVQLLKQQSGGSLVRALNNRVL